MGISFNQIPTDRLTPFVYVEFDKSRAVQGAGVKSLKCLLIGTKNTDGEQDSEEDFILSNKDQAAVAAGEGSLFADLARAWFENNQSNEVHGVLLDEAGGAKASGLLTFSGQATENGDVFAYVAGYRVKLPVLAGDDAAAVATALIAAFAEAENSHIPAIVNAGSSGVVNVIAKTSGEHGNEMDVRVNFYDDEKLPSGLSVAVTAPTGGSTNPDIQDALDAIGAEQYDIIVHPYTDSANLEAIEEELEARWGPLTQNDGVSISAKYDEYADLITYGGNRNSPHSVVMSGYKVPTPPWRLAAAVGAQVAFHGQIDPARPFQTLELLGCLAPAIADRFTANERNLILKAGLGTFMVSADGTVRIERTVTTYKTNEFDAQDTSYRDLETILTLSYLRWDLRNFILSKYPRVKLADDGTRFAPGQAIVTPKIMKAEVVMKFTQWESLGLVEGFAQFKRDLIVERNEQEPNRMDILLPTDVVNQLRVVGAQIQFLL